MDKAKCPRCGAPVLPADTQCLACGYDLLPPTPGSATTQAGKAAQAAKSATSPATASQTKPAPAAGKVTAPPKAPEPKVIVTTGDINRPYEIIGPVFAAAA